MSKRLMIVVNDPSFFLSHRVAIAQAAIEDGYEVHVATGPGEKAVERIREGGFQHHFLPLKRSGINIFSELKLIYRIFCLFLDVRPSIVHLVTLKPVIYGGLAAKWAKVPAMVAAISGLGYTFTSRDIAAKILKKIISPLISFSFSHPNLKVIFQNRDDRDLLVSICGLSLEKTVLIRGSGVNLEEYRYKAEPTDGLTVSFIARLLKDKGIHEFVEAVKRLKVRFSDVRFQIIGGIDVENPSSVSQEEIDRWSGESFAQFLGFRTDIAELISQSNIVVLPSYREGLPKVLVEAAACGRAVVTTNVPGCRDAIEIDKTGILVNVRDVSSLVGGIEKLLVNSSLRLEMGVAGRSLAEAEFDIKKIVKEHLRIYDQLLDRSK